jgi:parallel beta-helix repeat protein
MPTLPTPGADYDSWGVELNEWLAEGGIVHQVKSGYGAAGNGSTDDTAAIQAALDAANAAGGGTVFLPPGAYKITDQLVVENCTLRGVGVYQWGEYDQGSTIHITDTVDPAISLRSGGVLVGLNFYHPNQSTTSTPVVYPATVELYQTTPSILARETLIHECTFVNSYIAVDLNGDSVNGLSPSCRVIDNRICAISIGVNHPFTLIENQIQRNMFTYAHWPEGEAGNAKDYITANAIGVTIADGSGTTLSNNTFFGFGEGVQLYGEIGITIISNNMFDGCYRCISMDDLERCIGLTITGNHFGAHDTGDLITKVNALAVGGTIVASTGLIQMVVNGNFFLPAHGEHIWLSCEVGMSLTAAITGNYFLEAGANDNDDPHYSIYLDGQNLGATVVGNTFEMTNSALFNEATAIYIAGDGTSASISGNWVFAYQKGIDVSAAAATALISMTGNTFRNMLTAGIVHPSTGERFMRTANRIYDGAIDPATVASAATVTLGESDVTRVVISGTTTITSITASWPGRMVVLQFADVLTVTDGSNLVLAGNFVTSLDDTLTLYCDGTNWREMARSVN